MRVDTFVPRPVASKQRVSMRILPGRWFYAVAVLAGDKILVSRWSDDRRSIRRERAVSPRDRYVLSLALRSTKLCFSRGAITLAEGHFETAWPSAKAISVLGDQAGFEALVPVEGLWGADQLQRALF